VPIGASSEEINHRYDPHFDGIQHIYRKWRNILIESDHAALKRLLGYWQSFRFLQPAKATLSGIEAIRTIKRGHTHHNAPSVNGEIAFTTDCSSPLPHRLLCSTGIHAVVVS